MIWLELRVSQGHDFGHAEENEISGVIEEAIDVPARRVYCDAEANFMWCYVEFDRDRLNVAEVNFYRLEIERAFEELVERGLDEINIVDESVVAEQIPEAVR